MHLLAVQCLLTHGTIVTEPLPVWFYNLSCGVVNHQHCNKPSDHPGLITSELLGGPVAFKSSEGDQCKVTSVLCILSPHNSQHILHFRNKISKTKCYDAFCATDLN